MGADATAPLVEQLTAAAGPYVMTALSHVLFDIEARAERVPLIGVVGVFVVMGAEIVAVHGSAARGSVLQLTAPGGWFDAWRGRRFPHSGGGAWCEWPAGFDRAARRIDG